MRTVSPSRPVTSKPSRLYRPIAGLSVKVVNWMGLESLFCKIQQFKMADFRCLTAIEVRLSGAVCSLLI